MTRGARQAGPSAVRWRRVGRVSGGAGAALASLAAIVVLAAFVPRVLHVPVVLVLASVFAWAARAATRRGRHGLAAVVVLGAVLPLGFSEWSLWQSELLEASEISLWTYLFVINGACAVFLFAASRFTRARAFAPFGVIASAVSLLSLGVSLFPTGAGASRAWAGMVLVAFAGATWPLFVRSFFARVAARSVAAIASAAALALAAATWPSLTWGTSLAFLITAAACAVHLFWSPVAVDDRDGPAPRTRLIQVPLPMGRSTLVGELGAWKTGAAIALGLATAGAAAAPAVHFSSFAQQIDLTAGFTAGAAVLFAAGSRLFRHDRSTPGLRIAGIVTLAICALTVIPTIGIGVIETWTRIALPNFTMHAVEEHALVYPDVSPYIWVGAAALTAATTATLYFWGRLASISWLPLGLGGATLLIAHATAMTTAAAVVASSVLAVSATALFIVLRPRRGRRVILITLVLVSTTSSFLVGANSSGVWPVAALVTIGCLTALRWAVPRRVGVADRLAISPAITAAIVVFVLFTARWIPLWAADSFVVPAAASALATVLVASAILIVASVLAHRLVGTDASAMSALAAIAALLGIADLATHPTPAAQLHFVVGLACVLVAELSWQVSRGGQHSAARYITAVLTPPTAVLLAVESWRRFGPSVWGAPELLAVGIAVALAGLGIVLFRGRRTSAGAPRSHPARLGWDSSIALTSIVTVPAALTTSDFGALNLVLLGVLPILFALGEGSVSHGSSSRRHLIWACVPPFAGAIWLSLAAHGSANVELYALAMAGLVCAVLAIVASRRPPAHVPVPPGRNLLTIGALAVFLVPSVISSGRGPLGPTALVLLIATVLACIGAFLPPLIRGIHLALWLWSAGILTGALTTSIRAFGRVARAPFALDEILVWSICGALFLTIFGALWLRMRHPQARPGSAAIATAPLLLSLPLANVAAIFTVPWWMLTLVAAGTTAFLAFPRDLGSRAHALVTWMATTAAAFLAVGTLVGAHTAVEFVSVPVGLVAILVYLRRLRADSQVTSWGTLGVPLSALILPSLLQCLTDPAPARIAWLVVCIAAMAAFGVVTQLKAPITVSAAAAFALGLTLVWPAATSLAPGWLVFLCLLGLLAGCAAVLSFSRLPVARAVRSVVHMR